MYDIVEVDKVPEKKEILLDKAHVVSLFKKKHDKGH